jgi:hypothetical protein
MMTMALRENSLPACGELVMCVNFEFSSTQSPTTHAILVALIRTSSNRGKGKSVAPAQSYVLRQKCKVHLVG